MYQTWSAEMDIELNATLAVLKRFEPVSIHDVGEEATKKFDRLVKEGLAFFDHHSETWRPL